MPLKCVRQIEGGYVIDLISIGIPIIEIWTREYSDKMETRHHQACLFSNLPPCRVLQRLPDLHQAAGQAPAAGVATALQKDATLIVKYQRGRSNENQRSMTDQVA